MRRGPTRRPLRPVCGVGGAPCRNLEGREAPCRDRCALPRVTRSEHSNGPPQANRFGCPARESARVARWPALSRLPVLPPCPRPALLPPRRAALPALSATSRTASEPAGPTRPCHLHPACRPSVPPAAVLRASRLCRPGTIPPGESGTAYSSVSPTFREYMRNQITLLEYHNAARRGGPGLRPPGQQAPGQARCPGSQPPRLARGTSRGSAAGRLLGPDRAACSRVPAAHLGWLTDAPVTPRIACRSIFSYDGPARPPHPGAAAPPASAHRDGVNRPIQSVQASSTSTLLLALTCTVSCCPGCYLCS